MKKKIYLIGNIPEIVDIVCEAKFYKSQMQLTQIGFIVVNPIERLTNKDISFEEASKKNLQDLMFCDAVYIMPCFSYANGKKNLELKWALDFNLLVINGVFDITSNSQEITNDTKLKRRKRIAK